MDLALLVAGALPLGAYMARVYTGEARVAMRVLGPVEVRDGAGVVIAVPAPRQRALLARLALDAVVNGIGVQPSQKVEEALDTVRSFINVAERKLPTEAAYKAERNRRSCQKLS